MSYFKDFSSVKTCFTTTRRYMNKILSAQISQFGRLCVFRDGCKIWQHTCLQIGVSWMVMSVVLLPAVQTFFALMLLWSWWFGTFPSSLWWLCKLTHHAQSLWRQGPRVWVTMCQTLAHVYPLKKRLALFIKKNCVCRHILVEWTTDKV